MDNNKALLIRVAHMYYEQKKTQQEISKMIGKSRMAVSRLLQKARDEGIVEIKINYEGSYIELENTLKEKYKIKEFVISPYDEGVGLKKRLSEKTANLLKRILEDNQTVGVGWGSTLIYIPDYLEKCNSLDITFVPLLGGYGQMHLDIHANQLAFNLGRAFNGKSHILHAPAMVDTVEVKETFLSDNNIKYVLDLAKNANVALIGIGAPFGPETTLFDSGYFKKDDIEELKDAGAECDIVSCMYLDKEGNECKIELLDRTIGISSKDLKEIPLVIGVAGGKGKHLAIKLALESGVLDIAVIDERTAMYLLES